MKIEIKSSIDVRHFFENLTEDERKELGIRENFQVEARFSVNRNGLQGSFILNLTYEFKEGEEWVKVGEKSQTVEEIPQDLILKFTQTALPDKRVVKMLINYFGQMPDMSKIGQE